MAGRSAATVLAVLGALGLVTGLVLVVYGPELINHGYETGFSGERHITPEGKQLRNTGWVVAAISAALIVLGTTIYVSGKTTG